MSGIDILYGDYEIFSAIKNVSGQGGLILYYVGNKK